MERKDQLTGSEPTLIRVQSDELRSLKHIIIGAIIVLGLPTLGLISHIAFRLSGERDRMLVEVIGLRALLGVAEKDRNTALQNARYCFTQQPVNGKETGLEDTGLNEYIIPTATPMVFYLDLNSGKPSPPDNSSPSEQPTLSPAILKNIRERLNRMGYIFEGFKRTENGFILSGATVAGYFNPIDFQRQLALGRKNSNDVLYTTVTVDQIIVDDRGIGSVTFVNTRFIDAKTQAWQFFQDTTWTMAQSVRLTKGTEGISKVEQAWQDVFSCLKSACPSDSNPQPTLRGP